MKQQSHFEEQKHFDRPVRGMGMETREQEEQNE